MATEQIVPTEPSYGPQNWRLVRVKGQHPTLAWIAGPTISIFVHWDPVAKRTQPCVRGVCLFCDQATPRRPISYLPVYIEGVFDGHSTWRRAVLEVPLRTGLRLYDLRGRAVSLRRKGTCGLVEIATVGLRTQPINPSAWDIMPQLQTLWRIGRSVQISLVGEHVL